jgi:hypothetical protein
MGYIAQLLLYGNSTVAFEWIDSYIFGNLAGSITTTIRYLPRKSFREDQGRYVIWFRGVQFDAWRFHVHWAWLAFPILLVVCCIVFSYAVALSACEYLWKKSNLPLVFHGLGQRETETIGEIEDYVDMKEKASSMNVKFVTTKEGKLRLLEVDSQGRTMSN